MRLIINADDFGLNEQINNCIINSFQEGLCSSTTLMPNMTGFEEACQLAHENRLEDHVGLHLVLADGLALSDAIRRFPRFCNNEGQLHFSQKIPTLYLGLPEKEALAAEIRAQIKRCRDSGIYITHVDSHYHIHYQWGIAAVLIPIVREHSIPYIRIPRNCGPNLGLTKRAYKYFVAYRIRHAKLACTEYFGTILDYIFLKEWLQEVTRIQSFEVIIHPKFNDEHILIDGTSKMYLDQAVRHIDSHEDAVSFSGARYQ